MTGQGSAPTTLEWPGSAAVDIVDAPWGWTASSVESALDGDALKALEDELRALAAQHSAGAGIATGALATAPPKLLIMDVDSTLTTTEAIDLLADAAGAGEKVAAITERAMRGELDFGASLRERVATLEGLPVEVINEVAGKVKLSQGARDLVDAAHNAGAQVAVVSGGFIELVEPLANELFIDFSAANRLEVADGKLTGRTIGEVIDAATKARYLRQFAGFVGADQDEIIAVGDGANDLLMLAEAGLGIAYCAKPRVVEAARAFVPFARLDAVSAWFAGLNK